MSCTLRLAVTIAGAGATGPKNMARNLGGDSPTIRLAHQDGAQGSNVMNGERGVAPLPRESAPALLVSYYYLEPFLEHRDRYVYRDWALDSGAFSAHNSGVTIDLEEYIDVCLELLASDETLAEVFALDVIGDWRASLKNTERMWERGVPAIPCFHADEPWDALLHMAKTYPKIALGGVALAKAGKKLEWARQCFARVWPKKVHGFAYGGKTAIMALPFHSTDATNWELGPCKYGRWQAYNGALSVRGSRQDLRSEVEWYLKLEREARTRWAKEMALLETEEEKRGPTVRLADVTSGRARPFDGEQP